MCLPDWSNSRILVQVDPREGDASVVFPAGPLGEMEIRGLDSDGEVFGYLQGPCRSFVPDLPDHQFIGAFGPLPGSRARTRR